jgi:GntR family transcriptional regulator
MTSGSRIVSTGIVGADEDAASALQLDAGAYVVDLVRIRLADGSPISLEHVRLPAERFPRLLDLPLGGSLYDLLREHYDTEPGEAEEHIEVVTAGEDEASILGTAPGAPLLSIRRTTQDPTGVVFEYSHDLFRADRTVITVRTPAAARDGVDAGRALGLRPRVKR